MPKALSLKKVQLPISSKNQKPITQFFKNVNKNVDNQEQQKASSSRNEDKLSVEKTSNKRKASPLVDTETIHISDDGIHNKHKNGYHTPKKTKLSNGYLKTPSRLSTSKNSTQKENDTATKIFVKETDDTTCNSDMADITEPVMDPGIAEIRLPLSPVKVDNHVNIKISSNQKVNHKSCTKDAETHAKNMKRIITPKKVLIFESCCQNNVNKERTPSKIPKKRLELLKTPEKLTQEEMSPSKSGSTVKTQEISPGTVDGFGDQWDVDELHEDCAENLDLTIMQRCEVLSVTKHSGCLELRLKNSDNNQGTCFVDGIWLDTPFSPGEIVSVVAEKNSSGQYYVGNTAGLIALRPDHLLSCTSVVAAVFCKRKAVLQERFRGLDSGNTAMTIGILVHELVQKALTENIMEIQKLHTETDKIIKKSLQILYETGMNEEEAKSNMQQYILPLADFMQTYVAKSPLRKPPQKGQWNGHIDKVLDIEENLCCPQLGLKGKIDATVQVTIHGEKGSKEAALELKSGMARGSAEHRGQLALYGMALSVRRRRPPHPAPPGLLLYLKERVDVREVKYGHPERRDLTMLRNQLVQHLARGPGDIHPDEVADIEEAETVLQQSLPEPVHHHSACSKCPYLTLCSMHLWQSGAENLSEDHPLRGLRAQAVGHVSDAHARYFRHWAALLRAEELTAAPLHALWTDSPLKRAKRGTCAANLVLKSVKALDDRHLHVFDRQIKAIETLNSNGKHNFGPQESEFSVVSIDGRPWIAAGVVTVANETLISILLERDLSQRLSKDTVFHIDTYESYATIVHNLTNLGVLMEDSDRSARLRRLIIDVENPEFEKKLPREVGRLGSRLMRSLNIEQQRAVLKALAAKDYALLRGLPGTGKTQTISVLIQMLVGLKQRVLVTAHTHSAVDTVLSRLPSSLKVMRLGSSARVAPSLVDKCEQTYIDKCDTVKQMEELYESMEVVGVTCLGAAHAMLSRTRFDVCIVDEATQVLQSTVLRPLLAASRFVLVGDPDQLPPVVRSKPARRLGMEESLFHRLMREEATCTLRLQYRMIQPLADLANKVAYDGKLKCADANVANATLALDTKLLSNQTPWMHKVCSTDPENAALFLNIVPTQIADQNSKSCTNIEEACVVMAIVQSLVQCGLKDSEIGVIAPYREQVALLRRGLQARHVECSTVDQFQGQDKPVILYSCTKREEGDGAIVKEGEILNDQRRLAVSVTRAKYKLITVGNARALRKYQTLQRLIDASNNLSLDQTDLLSVVNRHKNEFV